MFSVCLFLRSGYRKRSLLGGLHARAIGSSKTVADILEKWMEETGTDGFNTTYAICPGDFRRYCEISSAGVPARGVCWNE